MKLKKEKRLLPLASLFTLAQAFIILKVDVSISFSVEFLFYH
jgi:hypothetical protein